MSRHRAPRPAARRAARRAAPRVPRTWTRHRLALALALVAALGVGAGGAGTYAFWNDRADIATGNVTAGSIDLQVQVTANGQTTWEAVGRDTGATRTDIAFTGRTPGEYEAYPLTLRNVGNPPGTYTLSVLRGGSWSYLNDAVLVQAFTGTVQEDASYPVQDTCSGTPVGSEQLISGAGPFTLTTSARALAAGGSDTICLRIGIATNAVNDNQNKSGTLVLRATLTQAQ